MRLQKKSLSRVALTDLLRRKKTNLERFLTETGIVTYELLLTRCASMGAVPPSEAEFLKAKGNPVIHEVSSPTEGIVVMQPLPEPVLHEALNPLPASDELEAPPQRVKKRSKKQSEFPEQS